MNIFVTDEDPRKSAKVLDDKRVIKMILESAQMLATSVNLAGGKSVYKTTHENHPCAVWARETRSNYMWLVDHFDSLCEEYFRRFKKRHASWQHVNHFYQNRSLIKEGRLTPFVNCTAFEDVDNVYLAYRLCLTDKWSKDKRQPKWTKASPPEWFQDVNDVDDRPDFVTVTND